VAIVDARGGVSRRDYDYFRYDFIQSSCCDEN